MFCRRFTNPPLFFLTDPVWKPLIRLCSGQHFLQVEQRPWTSAFMPPSLGTHLGFLFYRSRSTALTSLKYLSGSAAAARHERCVKPVTEHLQCLLKRSAVPRVSPWCFVILSFVGHSIPKTATKEPPSQFARPGKRRQCSNDVLKLGVSAALTAWSDAWGRGKGLFPCSVPSGTLPTTNKINKSASSTQEQSVCVGDQPYSKTCYKNEILFQSFMIHILSPTILHCFFLRVVLYLYCFLHNFNDFIFCICFCILQRTLNQVHPWKHCTVWWCL